MAETSRRGILAGGNWIVDRPKIIDLYPAQDTLANILSETTSNGGSPYNLLVDLARLGAPFPLEGVGLVGDDAAGAQIMEDCLRYGIDTRQIQVTREAPTSYTDVMTVQATGRRTFFHQRGANAFLDAHHFNFEASNARIFHLGYLLLLDRLDRPDPDHGTVAASVLKRAREAGMRTSIDLVSDNSYRFADLVRPALKYCDYLLLNEFEAERTTGIPILNESEVDLRAARIAAESLLAAGVGEWVVVHFPEGAIAVGRGVVHVQGSVRVPQARIAGTVGAGDAFAAGVLLGLHEGIPMEEALVYGVSAAALCLTDATTSGGILPLADCILQSERMGYRHSDEV